MIICLRTNNAVPAACVIYSVAALQTVFQEKMLPFNDYCVFMLEYS
ncbi:hypothetical protein SALWKB12_1146 [Snodgrassella communis]|uniref:Uncharacterized protein n=1 Tax=Snodgrassella communis TaxID=2946699 RepID=A0A836Z3D6_9NEIS|nr:hypothetical protein SALWKB12_1146 [Snodgrassella communis]KDN15428.1 hypothetical protein SALWKB29_0532 [Snodgrassella communis]